MIEIIRHGEATYSTKCKRCGCIFSYQNEDINEKSYEAHINGYKKTINCPECQNLIILEATK